LQAAWHPYVELVHWFNQILQVPDSDVQHIVREFGIEPSRLARDMTAALDQLPRGATSISDLSPRMEEAVERGWVYGTLLFGESQVRTGHLVGRYSEDAGPQKFAARHVARIRQGQGSSN